MLSYNLPKSRPDARRVKVSKSRFIRKNMYDARMAKGYTQEELALAIGISEIYYNMIENCKMDKVKKDPFREPSARIMCLIAKALDADFNEIKKIYDTETGLVFDMNLTEGPRDMPSWRNRE